VRDDVDLAALQAGGQLQHVVHGLSIGAEHVSERELDAAAPVGELALLTAQPRIGVRGAGHIRDATY
jgi:hypothetical protein